MIKKVKVSSLKNNPNNPRLIKDDKFYKLVESVKTFPEMLESRPIVVNQEMVVLGGNMRLKALIEAGIKEALVDVVDWPEEKQKEFVIKDNVAFGEWDWEQLANEWDTDKLSEWGLDIPNFDSQNYSDKNQEVDVNEFEDKMILKLQYAEDEYHIVKEALLKIAPTPEQAVFKLLKLNNE